MSAKQYVEPQLSIQGQRGDHDALRQVLSVCQLHHAAHVLFKISQERAVERVVMVLAADEFAHAPRTTVIETSWHAVTNGSDRVTALIDRSQDRPGVKTTGQSQAKFAAAGHAPVDGTPKGLVNLHQTIFFLQRSVASCLGDSPVWIERKFSTFGVEHSNHGRRENMNRRERGVVLQVLPKSEELGDAARARLTRDS